MQHVSLSGGLGISAGEIATIVQKIGPQIDTIGLVVNDPAFSTLMDRIRTLNAVEAKAAASAPSSGGSSSPSRAQVGVGLKWGVKALDAVIFARQNPWAVGVLGAGLVLFIGSIGFAVGRRGR